MSNSEERPVGLEVSGGDDAPEIVYTLTKRIDIRECESEECLADATVYIYDRGEELSEFRCRSHAP